jgi:transmembrane sensor
MLPEDLQDRNLDAALRWLAVLKDGPAAPSEQRAFEAWLAESAENARAWRRANAAWDRIGIVAPAVRRQSAPKVGPLVADFRPRRAQVTRRGWLRAAAGVAVIAGAGLAVARAWSWAEVRTGPAERRTVTLADGSSVELAGGSALSTSFSAHERRLTLHQGEAHFTVAKDAARPFVVMAAQGEIRALGTAFDVKHVADRVVVAVTEHAVSVSHGGGGSPAKVAVGQQVSYDSVGLGPVLPADLRIVEAWRQDRLVFQEAPLGDVIADLERNLPGRIFVTDSRINAIPVTAVFDARRADAALRTIAATLPIAVDRWTDLLIVLSPKE